MKIKATCTLCGAQYWKSNGKSKYCSQACREQARKLTAAKWKEAHPGYFRDRARKLKECVPEALE